MSYVISKGKLWLDGSGRVTVSAAMDFQSIGPRQIKFLVCPEDTPGSIRSKIPPGAVYDNEFAGRVLLSAAAARKDPKQQAAVNRNAERMQRGAEKSRNALLKRIRTKKEEAFKNMVLDLMQRGATRKQLAELIKEAVIEGVHKS